MDAHLFYDKNSNLTFLESVMSDARETPTVSIRSFSVASLKSFMKARMGRIQCIFLTPYRAGYRAYSYF